MANTLVLLEKVTVGAAGAASITFSNIPQTGYNDLVIKVSARGANAATTNSLWVQFNGSATSYTEKELTGSGSAASSGSNASTTKSYIGDIPAANATTSTFGSAEVYIPNYASANYKSFSADTIQENNTTAAYSNLTANLWSNTAAITSVSIVLTSSTLVQYSTFSLYGVSNVNTTPLVAPKATGGDIIQTDGTYWYHTFINSGTFTPATALSAALLVVGGGGGSGYGNNAGSGGGGGYLEGTGIALTATAYTVTVGGGGTTSWPSTGDGTAGVDSSFGSIGTAFGGGRGSGTTSRNGGNGGSGGGGGYDGSSYGTGGTATQTSQNGLTGFGNNGGGGVSVAGGGGAGGAASGTTGGAGKTSSLMGGTYAVGATGGGVGPNVTPTQNTGNSGPQGSAGGSGIVIVRYTV